MPTELSGTASCLREKLTSSEIKKTKQGDVPDVFFFWKVRGAHGGGVPDELGYVARIISTAKVEIKCGK